MQMPVMIGYWSQICRRERLNARKTLKHPTDNNKQAFSARFSSSLCVAILAFSYPLSAFSVTETPGAPVSNEPVSNEKVINEKAKHEPANNKKVIAQAEFPKGQIYTKGLGLIPAEVHLVNQGRFADLASKLAAKAASAQANRSTAWLAFAYLYLQKCDDLNKLANSYTVSPPAGNEGSSPKDNIDINLTLIKTFAYACDKKLDLADKELQKMPAWAMNDAFVNYAFATLSGKQGKAQVAITYTKERLN